MSIGSAVDIAQVQVPLLLRTHDLETATVTDESAPKISQTQLHHITDTPIQQFSLSVGRPSTFFVDVAREIKHEFASSEGCEGDEPFLSRTQVLEVLALLSKKCGIMHARSSHACMPHGTR